MTRNLRDGYFNEYVNVIEDGWPMTGKKRSVVALRYYIYYAYGTFF